MLFQLKLLEVRKKHVHFHLGHMSIEPVLVLDADWGSSGVLKDEKALCLDATFYGNVARFVNHR